MTDRRYTPARANPQSLDHFRIFLQQELDKIAQAFMASPEKVGGTLPVSGETGIVIYTNDGVTIEAKRVKIGAADSGGVGYRLLRVDN